MSTVNTSERQSLYAEVTYRIIAELEAGRLPWVQPWDASRCPCTLPHNAGSGRTYSGINVLILWTSAIEQGFSSQRWLTYRQAEAAGGHVRRGEKGTVVCYADRFTPREEAAKASAFACAALGIVPTVRHSDYIGAWLEVLRADEKAIFRAASAASKAADFLLACGEDRP